MQPTLGVCFKSWAKRMYNQTGKVVLYIPKWLKNNGNKHSASIRPTDFLPLLLMMRFTSVCMDFTWIQSIDISTYFFWGWNKSWLFGKNSTEIVRSLFDFGDISFVRNFNKKYLHSRHERETSVSMPQDTVTYFPCDQMLQHFLIELFGSIMCLNMLSAATSVTAKTFLHLLTANI